MVEKSPISEKRKCRDIICVILFTAFWGACAYIIYSFRLWEHYQNILVQVQPFDMMRRGCGRNDLLDALSVDYSKIANNVQYIQQFCYTAKEVYTTEMTVNGDYDGIDCSVIGMAGDANVISTRKFFRTISKYGNDQTNYPAGITVNKSTYCLPNALLEATETSYACNPPPEIDYICASDFSVYATKMSKSNSVYTQ